MWLYKGFEHLFQEIRSSAVKSSENPPTFLPRLFANFFYLLIEAGIIRHLNPKISNGIEPFNNFFIIAGEIFCVVLQFFIWPIPYHLLETCHQEIQEQPHSRNSSQGQYQDPSQNDHVKIRPLCKTQMKFLPGKKPKKSNVQFRFKLLPISSASLKNAVMPNFKPSISDQMNKSITKYSICIAPL